MKRICCLLFSVLLILCLLAGCAGISGTEHASESSAEALGSPQQETASNPEESSVTVEPAASVLPEGEGQAEPPEEPEPTPEPTPEPADSLNQMLPAAVAVYAGGGIIDSLSYDGAVMVREDQLLEAFPEISRQSPAEPAAETAVYTDSEGNTAEILMCSTDGIQAPQRPRNAGIFFFGGTEEVWLPLDTFCQELGLELIWDDGSGGYLVGMPAETFDVPLNVRVPTLMYHEVGDETWGIESLFVSPENVRAQLQYLYESGFDTIFFSDLAHVEDYDKPILLTFDDGYIGNYTELFPLLQEFGMKATVFVITESLGQEHYLTEDMVREMADSGLVSIQSHTVHHAYLAEISGEEQDYELHQSWLDILRITGKEPYVLSYPTGSHNDTTIEIGKRYYRFGVKMNGGTWYTGENLFAVDRLYVARSTGLEEYKSIVNNGY